VSPLHDILMSKRIVVCVGSGGVGKTTMSAVMGLHAAMNGRKVLVLTIDPARRLANSLGLEGIDHTETLIPLEGNHSGGELWAMMLDMKHAFDHVVRRNAANDATAQRILDNKYYHYFSSSLAGTQDFSAVERLAEIYDQGRYDLIVLDTPPTRHALDFIDAPNKLYEALNNSALQWLYRPALASGKVGLGIFKLGARYIRRTIGKFTGGTLLQDLSVFLESLSPLLDGFKERAAKVMGLLHDPSTVFFVVTSPDPLTVSESIYFDERLATEGVHFGGYIVNRVHVPVATGDETMPDPAALSDELLEIPGSRIIGAKSVARLAPLILRNAADFDGIARKDQQMLARLRSDRHAPVFPVPFYSTDIYTLTGLERVRADLLSDAD
jgi:anion-transporting  ArsA/GET3 family ATPase